MRKVILGEKYPDDTSKRVYPRTFPKDGRSPSGCPNVMDLQLQPWKDHHYCAFANTGNSFVLAIDNTDGKTTWKTDSKGRLILYENKPTLSVKYMPTTVKPMFHAKKKDGTNLYWVPYCAIPTSYSGDTNNLYTLPQKTDIDGDTSEMSRVYAVKIEGTVTLGGKVKTAKHTDKVFSFVRGMRDLANDIYLETSELDTSEEKENLRFQIEDILSTDMMQAWLEHIESTGWKVSHIRHITQMEAGWQTKDGEVIKKTAIIPMTYAETECQCVVSSDIVFCEDDDYNTPYRGFTETEEKTYVIFEDITYLFPLFMATGNVLELGTNNVTRLNFIKCNAMSKDYMRVTAWTSGQRNGELIWKRSYGEAEYFANRHPFMEVELFESPIKVTNALGYNGSGKEVTVTKLFAYCPEVDVYIGENETIVFPDTFTVETQSPAYDDDPNR